MSTQQDIYATGSESRPPMLNKENYVPWSSYLLWYAKCRPNRKLIHNSIINGPYVRRMIPEPGDANHKVTVTETFHVQTDDEFTDKELKQIEADDQVIQAILLGLPEDIYTAEKKAKLFNEWERFTSNEGESIESYYHCFLKLMNDLKRNKHFPEKIASNLKFLNNLQRERSRHVTIVHQTKDLHTADYTQLYEFLKYNQKEDVISKAVCAMCKKCLISVNHDKCLFNSVNAKKSCGKNEKAKVSVKEIQMKYQPKVIQICLWCVDSGCSKHMTGNLKLLINCIWKFMGTVRFENDHVAAIMGFGDLQWGNILITRVYFVEGLGHNLFSVGQFCDSDLEVAFRRNACFVRNLEGVDLLKGDRSTNLYTINLQEMASASSICVMARASSTNSWLWHQHLSHLNFDTINDLARNDLVASLPKFKYYKEHLCLSCEQGKSKRASHPPKPVPNSRQRLHLLPMDLCGTMSIASINGKRYVLVIVEDYSRYMWVHFLISKDEAPEVIIKFLKRITVLFQSSVIIIRTDNGTEFKNQVLKEYFDTVGISHQMSYVRTPEQNGVVERRNRALVEAARTMLIFSRTPLFLWAEAIATAKPDISFLHVFGALCYPKNDHEDIGKLGAKGDIGFFIGYFADSCAYRVYNRRTKKRMETMNVSFDELSAMAFEQRISKPGLQSMTSGHISSGLDLTHAPSTITTQQPSEGELDLLLEAMYDDYIGGQSSGTARTVPPAQEPQVRQTSTASTTIADIALIPTNSSSLATNIPISLQDVDELNPNAMVDGNLFVNPFANPSTSVATASSSQQNVDPSNMHTFYQPYPHDFQ
nr:retrovirus-related Pol polyprotein from transposon TNT 1-94 [Tanacetum cinerariifolium]